MNILAVESSCDETAVAIVRDGREVLTDCIASQVDLHRIYGGVVPEIASRKHIEAIYGLADQALARTGLLRSDIDAVAVTYAPGLIGAVLVGVNFAKAAALALAQAGCRVTVCARTPEKAAALAGRCGGVTVSWEDLPRAAAEHGLLLNATPLGMEGSPEFESLDFVQALPAKAVVYDLVYHPTDTALMRAAEHRGLTAVGGLALLVQQAALSFAHFTGIVLDAALCRDILQELEAAQ